MIDQSVLRNQKTKAWPVDPIDVTVVVISYNTKHLLTDADGVKRLAEENYDFR